MEYLTDLGGWLPLAIAAMLYGAWLIATAANRSFADWLTRRDREAYLWQLAEERVAALGLVYDKDGVIGCPTCGPNYCGQCGDPSPLVGTTVMQLKESIEHG